VEGKRGEMGIGWRKSGGRVVKNRKKRKQKK